MHGGPIRGRTEVAAFHVPLSLTGEVTLQVDGRVDLVIDEGEGLWPEDLRPTVSETLLAMFDVVSLVVLPALEPYLE